MSLKMVVFDVDGTLVDSQADILAAMAAAFDAVGRPVPGRAEVLSVVGLSLPQAVAQLAGNMPGDRVAEMVEVYKTRYAELRMAGGPESSPLYPGMRALLERLDARENLQLGIATGKSRRGLKALLESLDLWRFFVTTQVADDHPSKPHPSMLLTALAEAGVEAEQALMIGDTRYDIDMARAARMRAIGVGWGYHPPDALKEADRVVTDAAALGTVIDEMLEETA